jgi:hypothetical protein
LQNSAIWSNVSEVFSTSQTAVAFGIKGALLIFGDLLGREHAWRERSAPRRFGEATPLGSTVHDGNARFIRAPRRKRNQFRGP